MLAGQSLQKDEKEVAKNHKSFIFSTSPTRNQTKPNKKMTTEVTQYDIRKCFLRNGQTVFIYGKEFTVSNVNMIGYNQHDGKIWQFNGVETNSDRNNSIKGTGYTNAKYSITQMQLFRQS